MPAFIHTSPAVVTKANPPLEASIKLAVAAVTPAGKAIVVNAVFPAVPFTMVLALYAQPYKLVVVNKKC